MVYIVAPCGPEFLNSHSGKDLVSVLNPNHLLYCSEIIFFYLMYSIVAHILCF